MMTTEKKKEITYDESEEALYQTEFLYDDYRKEKRNYCSLWKNTG